MTIYSLDVLLFLFGTSLVFKELINSTGELNTQLCLMLIIIPMRKRLIFSEITADCSEKKVQLN